MNIEVPDGFHVMSGEEMQKLNVPDGMPGWCVSDPDRHIMMIISWKKSAFASLLINSQEVIRKSEASVRKASPWRKRSCAPSAGKTALKKPDKTML